MSPINLFYAEPDLDRWLPLDRFPRKLFRRILHGPHRPGGQMRVFLNLVAGLKQLDLPFRVNDFKHARRHPEELCCILGKRNSLDSHTWTNPLMIGPSVFDHPIDCPEIFEKWRVRRLLVPGEWMRLMCTPNWGAHVFDWPVGIDTNHWQTAYPGNHRDIDVLVYDKLRWDRTNAEQRILNPVLAELTRRKLRHEKIRYGEYDPENYRALLGRTRCMVFLCEHETQGLAYQEALASGVPVVAWDHETFWTDPNYYPERVRFAPVSAVPYWDKRCGTRFATPEKLSEALDRLETARIAGVLNPRAFILENLSLEKCAGDFVRHVEAASSAADVSPRRS